MSPNAHIAAPADEVDFIALWRVMWKHKYVIVLAMVVCALVAVVLALTTTPTYRAEVAVTEVSSSSLGGGSPLAGQFGGLASLVGVNLGTGGAGREAQALLKSRRLVEEFVKRQNLVPQLFPAAKQPPTLWLAVKQFQDSVLSFREDKRSGMTVIVIDWIDPATAARWANAFVALANEIIRDRAMEESKRNIAYLNEQVPRTSVVEVQRAMYNLIESETKTLMLANGRVEYAFTVVDPAVAPEVRFKPRRTIMVLAGLIIGFLLGTAGAFGRDSWIQSKRDRVSL